MKYCGNVVDSWDEHYRIVGKLAELLFMLTHIALAKEAKAKRL